MSLLFCLRRALLSLGEGVGGIQFVRGFDQQGCDGEGLIGVHANDCSAQLRAEGKMDLTRFMVRRYHDLTVFHVASLKARSSKRNGPLVLSCAGGKA